MRAMRVDGVNLRQMTQILVLANGQTLNREQMMSRNGKE